ncbi:hypothetical protein J6590_089831 [Homalodisca vitripennis]|nr:hypothetical protein J6590_089831 [Homalodisca vitripennis]
MTNAGGKPQTGLLRVPSMEFCVLQMPPEAFLVGYTNEIAAVIIAHSTEEHTSLATIMVGTSYGWTSASLDHLLSSNSSIPMTLDDSSRMVSIINFGQLISCFPSALAANMYGRKHCLLLMAPINFLSWISTTFTHSIWVLPGIRIVQGITLGAVCTILKMYISEIANH